MEYRVYAERDLPGILSLCAAEGWPSFTDDPARAHRALIAPGVTTVVATDDDEVVGFANLLSDGEIQAHLATIAVAGTHRRRGIARHLIDESLRRAGGIRIDLITDSAESFYESLTHRRSAGFRIYPPFT